MRRGTREYRDASGEVRALLECAALREAGSKARALPPVSRMRRRPKPANVPAPRVRPGTTPDPDAAREIENPGDPGPTVLVPPRTTDPLENPKLPNHVRRSGARRAPST